MSRVAERRFRYDSSFFPTYHDNPSQQRLELRLFLRLTAMVHFSSFHESGLSDTTGALAPSSLMWIST
jgi:hypothetical protein